MPEVSVILPVYNSEAYLKEAIDSILAQTFIDFELVIIDDGSTDSSAKIILSYNDPRIKYFKNETNKGLVFSLNRAVNEATGNYIARMDADDISLPERLEKQLAYLKKGNAALVASRVKLIDAGGKPMPDWKEDYDHVSFRQIKNYLRISNCIAHPTVLGRTDLFRKYGYRAEQKYSEDYDLWLRLVADGCRIEKLSESLLLYRVLPNSFTRSKKTNLFYGLAGVKFRFVGDQWKQHRFSFFVFSVFMFALLDLLKGAGKEVKAFFKK